MGVCVVSPGRLVGGQPLGVSCNLRQLQRLVAAASGVRFSVTGGSCLPCASIIVQPAGSPHPVYGRGLLCPASLPLPGPFLRYSRYYNKEFMALLRQTTEERKGRAPGSEAVAA